MGYESSWLLDRKEILFVKDRGENLGSRTNYSNDECMIHSESKCQMII